MGERKNAKDPSPLEVKEVLVGERRYVVWLRSQVQGCCAKVFSAVGVALPPLLTLEPEGKRVAKNAADESG